MKNRFLIMFLVAFSTNIIAADIKVSGGAAPMNNIFKKIKDTFEKQSGHRLILNEQSPELALQALDKGEIQVATAGLAWVDWVKLCKEKSITIDESKSYRYSSVGKDSIQVLVNAKSPVSKLSFEQLEKIFTGVALNWKEFGGPDKAIKIVFSKNIAGTNKFFSKTVLGGKEYRKDLIESENANDIAQKIGKDADAIGFGPAGLDHSKYGIKVVEHKEIFRPIMFAFLSPDKAILDLKNFIASPDGEALVKK